MSNETFDPQNSSADTDTDTEELTAPGTGAGTAGGAPTEGVEIDEADVEDAVVPDDKSIDGPTAGHA